VGTFTKGSVWEETLCKSFDILVMQQLQICCGGLCSV